MIISLHDDEELTCWSTMWWYSTVPSVRSSGFWVFEKWKSEKVKKWKLNLWFCGRCRKERSCGVWPCTSGKMWGMFPSDFQSSVSSPFRLIKKKKNLLKLFSIWVFGCCRKSETHSCMNRSIGSSCKSNDASWSDDTSFTVSNGAQSVILLLIDTT